MMESRPSRTTSAPSCANWPVGKNGSSTWPTNWPRAITNDARLTPGMPKRCRGPIRLRRGWMGWRVIQHHLSPEWRGLDAMKIKLWLAGLALTAALVGLARPALAQDTKDPGAFGALEPTAPDVVKAKAQAWLKKATNDDAA